MINEQTRALAAQMLRIKLANELANDQGMHPSEAMHESAESPEAEMLEHSPGGYEAGGEEHHEHGGDAEAEHMLSQLSPEELEHLATQLHGDHAGAEEQPEHDTAGLAQELEQHLAQTPEANPEGVPAEKMAALEFVKSASYIEGFLDHALAEGANVKEAVDMYDSVLTETIQDLYKSSGLKDLFKRKGMLDHATDAAGRAYSAAKKHGTKAYESAKKSVSDAASAAKKPAAKAYESAKKSVSRGVSSATSYAKKHPGHVGGAAAATAATGVAAHYATKKDSEKTAAYYDGVFERAAEYGISYSDAVDFIKSAGLKDMVGKGVGKVKELVGKARQAYVDHKHPYRAKVRKAYEATEPARAKAKEIYSKHPAAVAAVAGTAGLGAGYRLGKGKAKEDESEKTAAYCAGIFKQAIAYGYSENEAMSFVESALDKVGGIRDLFRKKNMLEKIHDAVSEYGGRAVDAAKKHGPEAYETAKDYAKKHPVAATGVGAGLAGIAAGRLSKED
jgi:ElaB/YqjD/DUF883 family membrane-anchored ribosome-binding protein